MIHDQDEFAKKITGYLDAGAADLRAGTALQAAAGAGKALARLAEPARAAETAPRRTRWPARVAHASGSGAAPGRLAGIRRRC